MLLCPIDFFCLITESSLTSHYNEIELMIFLWSACTCSHCAITMKNAKYNYNIIYSIVFCQVHPRLEIQYIAMRLKLLIKSLTSSRDELTWILVVFLQSHWDIQQQFTVFLHVHFINQLSTNSNRRCDYNRTVEPSCLLTNLLSKTSILLFQLLKV